MYEKLYTDSPTGPHPEQAEGRVEGLSSPYDADKTDMSAYVYIVNCADARYYVGTTRGSLEKRIAEHNAGTFGGYTKSCRPVTLVYHQAFERITDAVAAERQLKGWSRAKKEALIKGDFEALRHLAKPGSKRAKASFDWRATPAAQDEVG